MAIAGANIQYILTGEKTSSIDITTDENELFIMYRNAPLAIKAAALGALTAGTAQQKGVNQVVQGSNSGLIISDAHLENVTLTNYSGRKRK